MYVGEIAGFGTGEKLVIYSRYLELTVVIFNPLFELSSFWAVHQVQKALDPLLSSPKTMTHQLNILKCYVAYMPMNNSICENLHRKSRREDSIFSELYDFFRHDFADQIPFV